MNKQILSIFVLCAFSYSTQAQEVKGGISDSMMQQIKQSYANTPTDKAIRNAIGSNDIRKLALNQDNLKGMDTHFSIKVPSKGITDQKSSGRCWLFTGLNVMRAKAIAQHNLGSFEFSQTYPFFFDQLEKANLFLQGIIDTSDKPMDDKMVEWLFRNPLSDGGTFTGVADIVSKYGLVPKDVMPETNGSYDSKDEATGVVTLSNVVVNSKETTATIEVKAKDGTTKRYTLVITKVAVNTDLMNVTVNGTTVSNANGTYTYLKTGISSDKTADVSITTQDANSTVKVEAITRDLTKSPYGLSYSEDGIARGKG